MLKEVDNALNCTPISPYREMAAYEALWARSGVTFKTVADCFRDNPGTTPSDLVSEDEINAAQLQILSKIGRAKIRDYGIQIYGSQEYPGQLRDATHPIQLLYYRGWWDLVDSPKRIAIVGSRHPSEDGIKRTQKLVKSLVEDGYTIVSGLAKGVDTAAHTTAIDAGGKTIAVIGTPITESYPPENKTLQEFIATEHLLVSQVPIWRYSKQNYLSNRFFFPERNATMSALAQATVIVEASETSGTLVQARAALQQGRKLFILDNCFRNANLTWPERFEKQGAIRVRDIEDIRSSIG